MLVIGCASRLCMGAAWREVRDGLDLDRVAEMVEALDRLEPQVVSLGSAVHDQSHSPSAAER